MEKLYTLIVGDQNLMISMITAKNHFLKILSDAQTKRSHLREMQYDPIEGHEIPKWIIFERLTMLKEINRWRSIRRYDPITERKLFTAEQHAVGHIDYSSKFALYCAELATQK